MGRFYGLKIRRGEMALEDVQAYWRPAVEKWLADNPVD